jgi:opacity protein-like surface antigen
MFRTTGGILSVSVLLLFGLPDDAAAQFMIQPAISINSPLNEFANDPAPHGGAESGVGYGLRLSYKYAPAWWFFTEGMFYRFPAGSERFKTTLFGLGIQNRFIGTYPLFAQIGLGWYQTKYDAAERSDWTLGINLGLRYQFDVIAGIPLDVMLRGHSVKYEYPSGTAPFRSVWLDLWLGAQISF